jgi:hypothetical protein
MPHYDIDSFSEQDWRAFVFDHPVATGQKAWCWDDEFSWSGKPRQILRLSTRLFDAANSLQASYTSEQLEQGFWFLLSGPCDLASHLWNQRYAWARRHACIESMVTVFSDLFSVDPLEYVCHMWWDLLRYFGDTPDTRVVDAIVRCCERILELDSLACQVSGLHGLGHFPHPDRRHIITRYLRTQPNLDEETRKYALAARRGKVL